MTVYLIERIFLPTFYEQMLFSLLCFDPYFSAMIYGSLVIAESLIQNFLARISDPRSPL